MRYKTPKNRPVKMYTVETYKSIPIKCYENDDFPKKMTVFQKKSRKGNLSKKINCYDFSELFL